MKHKECEYCDEQFAPNRPGQYYCSLACQLWSRVHIRGPLDCWEWHGAVTSMGYGTLQKERKHLSTHRVAWMLKNGEIPEGLVIRHAVCDNPRCCNPDHLALGTQADNMADRAAKGRYYSQKGDANYGGKLTSADVLSIAEDQRTYKEIAADYNVSPSNIGCIKSGVSWAHVTGITRKAD